MAVTFTIYITDEGIRATREVQQNPGWYIIPYQFRVSDTNRGINAQRTYASIDSNPWYSGAFSALTASGTENKIIHNVVVPPILTTATTEKNYGEIYFIYKNHNEEELLYAIGAPSEELTYVPGVSQKFYFSFALNNVQVKDTIYIQNTDAQDIEDHNIDLSAHTYKANVSLDNLDSAGQAVLDGKANVSLNNLDSDGQAVLDAKANLSLGNVTSTAFHNVLSTINTTDKSNIIGWGAPDYTHGVNKITGTNYTASENGWLYGFYYTTYSNNTSYFTIDGVQIKITKDYDPDTTRSSGGGGMVMIAKGSVYSGTELTEFKFFPCKN